MGARHKRVGEPYRVEGQILWHYQESGYFLCLGEAGLDLRPLSELKSL